uniref:Uncharacterized protein n=1 Tax=Oryza meridionalis TaxID=40149 RepID=A0A0E0E5V1_9ORYZ
MRRRRWPARRAAALCIAVVVLQLAAAAAAARSLSSSRHRAHGHGHRVALPASAAAASLQQPVHRAVAKAKGGGRSTAFDAGGGVPCKEKSGGHGGAPSPCSDDDDDKRVVPTGPNPLHNRNKNCPHQLFLHGVFVSIPQVEDSAVHHV